MHREDNAITQVFWLASESTQKKKNEIGGLSLRLTLISYPLSSLIVDLLNMYNKYARYIAFVHCGYI